MSGLSNAGRWFVQLSGWPVFLAVVALVFLLMIALSIGLTWLGNRTVAQSAAIAVLALTLLTLALLALAAVVTRLGTETIAGEPERPPVP